ncbi:hypothetical protein J6590_007132 [Homalodisca vitripennis]|nr:hypothetical protein J6590_007132 [Homalodisca vitripennis]
MVMYQAMMAMGGMPTTAGVAPLPATGLPPSSNPPLPGIGVDKSGVETALPAQDKNNKRAFDAGKAEVGAASPLQATKKAKKEIKETLEEMTEAEKAFDEQFKNWESQFMKWKEQNINHPDKFQRNFHTKYAKDPSTIYEWHKYFSEMECSVNHKSGCPSTSDKVIEQVRQNFVNSPTKLTQNASCELQGDAERGVDQKHNDVTLTRMTWYG